MSANNLNLILKTIDPSWLKYFHELHWSGQINAYLGKGYASFTLTDTERKKWGITKEQESRISEILQTSINETNAKVMKQELLSLLVNVESISIPNKLEDKLIIDEIHKETDESIQSLTKEVLPFVNLVITNDFENFEKTFISWKGRQIRNILHKGMSIIVENLLQKEIFFSYTTIEEIEAKKKSLQPFYLLLYYHFNKYPDKERINIFKHFLLQQDKVITDSIDGIIYRSWKQYPAEMYTLTKDWILSNEPILINWLIHGVECPGRTDPLKAFNFLKPIFTSDDSEVQFILSHVIASILCADPLQTFHIFEGFLEGKKEAGIQIQNRLTQGLTDIITDKFFNQNYNDFDFPNLKDIIIKKMYEWNNIEDSSFYDISTIILKKIKDEKNLLSTD